MVDLFPLDGPSCLGCGLPISALVPRRECSCPLAELLRLETKCWAELVDAARSIEGLELVPRGTATATTIQAATITGAARARSNK